MRPARVEQIAIVLELNKSKVDKFEKELKTLVKYDTSLMDDEDTLKINYKFFIEYFSNVGRALSIIRTIISDPKIIRSINIEELRHGESILLNLVDEIRAIQNLKD